MTDTTNSLGQYGKAFQEGCVQALMVDKVWAEQILEVFDPAYFDQKYLQFLASRYFEFWKKYKSFPSIQMLVTIIGDELKKGSDLMLKEQVVSYLVKMKANPNPGDIEFIKEKSLDFCRKQALKFAMGQAVDCIASNDGNYEQIVEIIKKAVMVGTAPSVGHDFFEDVEARFITTKREVIPTGLSELDKKEILQGGAGKGELNVVLANTGVGKSHLLVALGANALKQGFDVVHYTLELSETAVGTRYDSYLCDIDSNEIIDNKEKVTSRLKDTTLGKLVIKSYPPNMPTIYTLKSHLERLVIQKNIRPAMVIIDYADIMRSTRKFDSLRHELKLAYEELRAFAMEMNVVVWTASQSNKDGANSDVVDMSNMSEAYGKAMVADFIVSISRKSYEKANGQGRLYIAKNRAGKDGILYPININTARSQFTITSGPSDMQEFIGDDKEKMKDHLKSRWNELKNSNLVKKDQG